MDAAPQGDANRTGSAGSGIIGSGEPHELLADEIQEQKGNRHCPEALLHVTCHDIDGVHRCGILRSGKDLSQSELIGHDNLLTGRPYVFPLPVETSLTDPRHRPRE
ncbi:hypothetical protein ACKI1Q_10290 [Streptomyces galilaeus]|uniref:hypothetical protein n=1 Tax=Streptomyces galilaeus TaxID=33899 RepID=UPI0038F73B1D